MALLEVHDVEKRFGGVQALGGVSLDVGPGEIVGLIGPNGAGKTTLFHLVSGFVAPDRGVVRLDGTPTAGLSPHALCRRGLARTFQIVKPFPGLTVLENVRVGALVRASGLADATWRARDVVEFVGLGTKARDPARTLTLAERKRLELARALATEPRLLLLDEVMAGLNATETGQVVELCRRINARGVAILLIEHVMRAVMTLSHRVVVLSQGRPIAEGPPASIAGDRRVIEAYLGEEYPLRIEAEPGRGSPPPAPPSPRPQAGGRRSVGEGGPRTKAVEGPSRREVSITLLRVEGLAAGYGDLLAIRSVSLEVREGECVALFGANGAGKTTTLRAISGLVPIRAGRVLLAGESLAGLSTRRVVERGMAHVPEGRQVFPSLTVRENLEMGARSRSARAARKASFDMVFGLFPRLRERERQPAGTLSGGEQQMLAIARGLMARPRLLLLDEPSLGLAPLVVSAIFQIVETVNRQGTTILLVEQNIPRALQLCHRGYVLENGEVTLSGAREELLGSGLIRQAYLGL
jgi:branched-chain amino acid transport system ATP-binding protein